MTNCIIKICGIRDAHMATQTAIAGAHLIGIIFHPFSARNVSVKQAALISAAVRKAGAEPVAVFVNQSDVEMRHVCEATDIHIVQLHGAIARAYHHLLPARYQRIYVQTVGDLAELSKDAGLCYLEHERDFILIDHVMPGQGKKINWKALHYDLGFRWLLAGGLTPANVATAINILRPQGVDVSSGVETAKGKKDITLIQQFITSVRGLNHVT